MIPEIPARNMTTDEIKNEVNEYCDRLPDLLGELGDRGLQPLWTKHLAKCLIIKVREIGYLLADLD